MQSCDLLVCCKNERSKKKNAHTNTHTHAVNSPIITSVVSIFVIALLIASHEMNYKIIGMLFI